MIEVVKSAIRSAEKTQNVFSKGKDDKEIEIRFGHIISDRGGIKVVNGVKKEMFDRLINFLTSNFSSPRVEDSVVSISADSIRKIEIGTTVKWEKKERIFIQETAYPFRVAISKEKPLSPPASFQPVITRKRQRQSFDFLPFMIVECTTVEEIKDGKQNGNYEVEIEFPSMITSLNEKKIGDLLLKIYSQLYGTLIPYTLSEYETMFTEFNSLLGSKRTGEFDHNAVSKARNIKWSDLESGAIVDNPQTNYVVSFKADGVRKFIFVQKNKKLWIFNSNEIDFRGVIITDKPFLLESEEVQVGSRTLYLVYDCLSYGATDFTQQPYYESDLKTLSRARVAERLVASKGNELNIFVQAKKVYPVTSANFFSLILRMLEVRSQLDYQTDGLIFTPAKTPYRFFVPEREKYVDNMDVAMRYLQVYPDIVKWKPDVTIDFRVALNPKTVELQVWDYKRHIPFNGTTYFPVDPLIPRDELESFFQVNKVVDGEIIEFQYDTKTEKFIPYRVRPDKIKANSKSVAEANWDSIVNPITAEDLSGRTFSFVRKYHNKIKGDILKKIKPGSRLLDIGGGRGGDLGKWKKLGLQHIYIVEPNAENLSEFKRRAERYQLDCPIDFYQGGGEDTEQIKELIGTPVDVITMMLSASFFWKNESMVDALINTITQCLAPGGRFLIFTIDGDAVLQVFEPTFSDRPISQFQVLGISFELQPPSRNIREGRRLEINYPDTIVGKQTEYCVMTKDISSRLFQRGFVGGKWLRADKMGLATADHLLISSMYSYSYYRSPHCGERTLNPVDKQSPNPVDKQSPNPVDKQSPNPVDKQSPNPVDKQSESSSSSSNLNFNWITIPLAEDRGQGYKLPKSAFRNLYRLTETEGNSKRWTKIDKQTYRKAIYKERKFTLLESVIFAVNKEYRDTSWTDRILLMNKFWDFLLSKVDSLETEKWTAWELAENGDYPYRLARDDRYYNLGLLRDLLNHNQFDSNFVSWLSIVTKINIFIVGDYDKKIFYRPEWPVVFILSHRGLDFEPLGWDTEKGTVPEPRDVVFPFTHPLVTEVMRTQKSFVLLDPSLIGTQSPTPLNRIKDKYPEVGIFLSKL